MLSSGNGGVMNFVKPTLSILPFVLLLSERKWRTASKYLLLYAVCFALERMALHVLSGLPAFLLLAVCSLMISVVKIGDELSAAALTRGLGAPVRRTDICNIGFHAQDVVMIVLCAAAFVLTIGSRWIG